MFIGYLDCDRNASSLHKATFTQGIISSLEMALILSHLTHVSGNAFESLKRRDTMNHSSSILSPNFVFPYRWAGTSPEVEQMEYQ